MTIPQNDAGKDGGVLAAREKPRLLAVVGPTASGKSALAVELAKRLSGEIVSCDSMQVYRGMDIGTAKPTDGEKGGVPHHLIDIVEPDSPYSCGDYVEAAARVIKEIRARGNLPIICGGTGLYLDSLLRGGMADTKSDPELRRRLFDEAEKQGNHALHERLCAVDPESAEAIHENNVKRVVRALEIYETTGMTKTELDRCTRESDSPYHATVVGLRYPDRQILYDRIDRRVDAMLEAGLLQETERLYRSGVFAKNATAAQAIGYKELLGVIEGNMTLPEAAESLKQATRRYAKRQLTWFGARPYVRWLDMTDADGGARPTEELVREVCNDWGAAPNPKRPWDAVPNPV